MSKKRNFLFPVLFLLCFSAFPQEPLDTSASGSGTPSERLWNIVASLEELERSETLSLEALTTLREDLTALEELLATSESMLNELQMQVDDALQRYEKLYLRYEKQRKQLNGWRAGCLGSSAFSVILIILLCLL
jgi:TolA-binding protein